MWQLLLIVRVVLALFSWLLNAPGAVVDRARLLLLDVRADDATLKVLIWPLLPASDMLLEPVEVLV